MGCLIYSPNNDLEKLIYTEIAENAETRLKLFCVLSELCGENKVVTT